MNPFKIVFGVIYTASMTPAELCSGAKLVGGVPTYPTDGGFWAKRKNEAIKMNRLSQACAFIKEHNLDEKVEEAASNGNRFTLQILDWDREQHEVHVELHLDRNYQVWLSVERCMSWMLSLIVAQNNQIQKLGTQIQDYKDVIFSLFEQNTRIRKEHSDFIRKLSQRTGNSMDIPEDVLDSSEESDYFEVIRQFFNKGD